MKSTSGAHFIALDHVRAFAAFMVICWHFAHEAKGFPVPFGAAPAFFPMALLDQGHTGVALFMTLSGYLFFKLLDGKSIIFTHFIWNRAMRLLPLLVVVLVLVGIEKMAKGAKLQDLLYYLKTIILGCVLPGLPNGGWSITVEFHFYLLLPFLLPLMRRSSLVVALSLVMLAIAVRALIWQSSGEVQTLAYWTIVGRIDQFLFGMLAAKYRHSISGRHLVVLITIVMFSLFYWKFDELGGFWEMPTYPSPSALWILLPTVEGAVFGLVTAWYDSSFTHSSTGISAFLAKAGEYSYSIYLLHFFLVFRAAKFVHIHIMDISNLYVACAWALVFYTLMLIPAYLSYRFVESPFMKMRKKYTR